MYCNKPGHSSLFCYAWKYGRKEFQTQGENTKGKGKFGKGNYCASPTVADQTKVMQNLQEQIQKLKKQLLKGRATASVTEEGDSEDEDMEENEEGRSLGSHKEGKKSSHVVPRPHVPVPSFETLKRKRDADISNGNNQEASKKTRSENGFVTEAEIRDALEAAGGSMKQKDFTRRFKKRIKISKAHKERFMAVIRNVVVQNDDPVRGPVYVLKEVWHS